MINWQLRLKNKATLTALIASVLAFAYQVCGIFGAVPPISQEQATQALGIVVNLLVALGVLVDPTTAGVGDSAKALAYAAPSTGDIDAEEDDGYATVEDANAGRDGKGDDAEEVSAPKEDEE